MKATEAWAVVRPDGTLDLDGAPVPSPAPYAVYETAPVLVKAREAGFRVVRVRIEEVRE